MIDFNRLKKALVRCKEDGSASVPALNAVTKALVRSGAINTAQSSQLREALNQETLFGTLGDPQDVNALATSGLDSAD